MNMGLDVVLAHADKYSRADVERFIIIGARLQINADAFTSILNKKPHVYDWIERGDVVALGSDIHKKDKGAYKRFLKAQKKIGNNLEYISKKSNEIWDTSKEYPL